MKLARRRAADEPSPSAAATPVTHAPPRGRPVAAHASIVDGERLWVAIEAGRGSLALRPTGAGAVLELVNTAADDQPGYTACCLDLTGLPSGNEQATYDVVLAGTRSPVALWTPPMAAVTPRPARDGVNQHQLRRGPDGTLQLTRTMLPAAATLRGAVASLGSVRLALAGAGPLVAALDDQDQALATWDVVDQSTIVTLEALDGLAPQPTRLVSGEPGDWRPIRRRGNDLPDPGKGAPLPPVFGPGQDEPRIRLRWSPQALLVLRIMEVAG